MNCDFRLYRVIPLITLPLFAMLSWSQFNWLEELHTREQRRIEASMVSSAQSLATRLNEEVNFLPSLFRLNEEDLNGIETLLPQRFRFWQQYAIDPAILKEIYLFNDIDKTIMRWDVNHFKQISSKKAPEPPFIGMDDNVEIRIVSPVIMSPNGRLMADFSFDKRIIVSSVIPKLAKKSLDSSGLYRYRIIDTDTETVIYASDALGTGRIGNPDIEIKLIDDIFPFGTPGQSPPRPGLDEDQGGDRHPGEMRPSDIATKDEIPRDGRPRPPTDKDAPSPSRDARSKIQMHRAEFGNVILQIYNRDGSLERLSKRTSYINAVVSFGTFCLLVLLIAALINTTKRSRNLAQRQREFIATITHELKTPLSVITSAAENLNDGLVRDQSKAKQYGTIIKKETARLALSIDHFLLYSKTNSNVRMKLLPCDLGDLISTSLKITEKEREKLGMTTEISIPEEPIIVTGDRLALESVFINLTQNVVRHASGGKYLGITVRREKERKSGKNPSERLIITVRDKGPGIPLREQKLIFEPFARGKRAMEEQIPGNGIGLNLVKRIVEMHGGTITVESKPDSGTTFTVSLPPTERS